MDFERVMAEAFLHELVKIANDTDDDGTKTAAMTLHGEMTVEEVEFFLKEAGIMSSLANSAFVRGGAGALGGIASRGASRVRGAASGLLDRAAAAPANIGKRMEAWGTAQKAKGVAEGAGARQRWAGGAQPRYKAEADPFKSTPQAPDLQPVGSSQAPKGTVQPPSGAPSFNAELGAPRGSAQAPAAPASSVASPASPRAVPDLAAPPAPSLASPPSSKTEVGAPSPAALAAPAAPASGVRSRVGAPPQSQPNTLPASSGHDTVVDDPASQGTIADSPARQQQFSTTLASPGEARPSGVSTVASPPSAASTVQSPAAAQGSSGKNLTQMGADRQQMHFDMLPQEHQAAIMAHPLVAQHGMQPHMAAALMRMSRKKNESPIQAVGRLATPQQSTGGQATVQEAYPAGLTQQAA